MANMLLTAVKISETIYYLKILSMFLGKRIAYVITTKTNAVMAKHNTNFTETFCKGQERTIDIDEFSANYHLFI